MGIYFFIGKYINDDGIEYSRVYTLAKNPYQACITRDKENESQGKYFEPAKTPYPEIPKESTDVWNQVHVIE